MSNSFHMNIIVLYSLQRKWIPLSRTKPFSEMLFERPTKLAVSSLTDITTTAPSNDQKKHKQQALTVERKTTI